MDIRLIYLHIYNPWSYVIHLFIMLTQQLLQTRMHAWINEYLASCLSYSKIQSIPGYKDGILKGTITKMDKEWTRLEV